MAGTSVADNIARTKDAIAKVAHAAGREPSSVRLIAVSKTKPIELIQEAFAAGQKSFGENYVQEALAKVAAFPDADWHFIGSLQSNKAKQVVGKFSLIHSVDRLKLAEELSKAAQKMGTTQDILLQVHIGDEETKHGVSFDEAPQVIQRILELPGLRLRGLMSLPPLSEDENTSRGYFAQLRNALEAWRKNLPAEQAAHFHELSMGTSSDYEAAVREGATFVRVGTSIFGARER